MRTFGLVARSVVAVLLASSIALIVDARAADAATVPPTMSSPANAGSYVVNHIPVSFILPQAPLANSVRLTITNGSTTAVVTLNDTSVGAFSMTLDTSAGLTDANVLAYSGPSLLPAGTYTAVLAYQNAANDPVATSVGATFTLTPLATTTTSTSTTTAPASTTSTALVGGVVAQTTTTTSSSTSVNSAQLAATGVSIVPVAIIGAVLLLIGSQLLVFRRSR